MKIQFEDKSYVYFSMSDSGKIILVIGAKDYNNPSHEIVNSCEVSVQEFNKLVSDLEYKEK